MDPLVHYKEIRVQVYTCEALIETFYTQRHERPECPLKIFLKDTNDPTSSED